MSTYNEFDFKQFEKKLIDELTLIKKQSYKNGFSSLSPILMSPDVQQRSKQSKIFSSNNEFIKLLISLLYEVPQNLFVNIKKNNIRVFAQYKLLLRIVLKMTDMKKDVLLKMINEAKADGKILNKDTKNALAAIETIINEEADLQLKKSAQALIKAQLPEINAAEQRELSLLESANQDSDDELERRKSLEVKTVADNQEENSMRSQIKQVMQSFEQNEQLSFAPKAEALEQSENYLQRKLAERSRKKPKTDPYENPGNKKEISTDRKITSDKEISMDKKITTDGVDDNLPPIDKKPPRLGA